MIEMSNFNANDLETLTKVIDNKAEPRHTILKGIESYVQSRYAEYLTKTCHLERIDESTIDLNVPSDAINEKYSLIHMYESQEQYAKTYLKDIKESLKNGIVCPYCGLVDSKQIDHFLPKSKFPEFSLFLPNMIPICSDCNKSKDNIAIDTTTNTRFVLNPYYDSEIYQYDFIECKIQPPFEAAKFIISFSGKLDFSQQQICKEHIKTVEIEHKITKLWRNYFNELSKRLEKTYHKKLSNYTTEKIVEKFIEIITDEIDTKGIHNNVIHKALFTECANNQPLLKFWINQFRLTNLQQHISTCA